MCVCVNRKCTQFKIVYIYIYSLLCWFSEKVVKPHRQRRGLADVVDEQPEPERRAGPGGRRARRVGAAAGRGRRLAGRRRALAPARTRLQPLDGTPPASGVHRAHQVRVSDPSITRSSHVAIYIRTKQMRNVS